MNFLNINFNKYFISFLVLIIFFTFFLLYLITKIDNNENLINNLENNFNTTKYLFEEQKRYALSLAILLSKDDEIIKSFLAQDREKSFELINKKIATLKNVQELNFEVQIHNQNLTTYLQSWDISKKDIKLYTFRKGLIEVKNNKQPFVSIELGKRLNIKAISPFILEDTFLGSIEVIIGFDILAHQLEKMGYKLFVLLDKKHLNIATELTNNELINRNYILVNQNNSNILKDLDLTLLKDYGYISNENYAFSYFSYYDLNENHLGYIMIAIDNKNHIKINKGYEFKQKNITKIIKII